MTEAQRREETGPESHSRTSLPAWALSPLALRTVGSIPSLTLTPDSTDPHCSAAPFLPNPPGPPGSGCCSQGKEASGSLGRSPEPETFPEPARLSCDLLPLSLPVYSTPWQKAPGGEFMSQKEGSGEGRGGQMSVCGCEGGGERGGSREFKEKATQSVCLCEREGTALASQWGSRDRDLLVQENPPREPLSCPGVLPGGCPRSGASLGVPRPLLVGQAAGDAAPRNLHPPQSARVACPQAVFSDTPGDPGPW